MENIFQQVLQMCIYGSIATIVVLILRKVFQRLPKKITCLFWLIPGLRLLCPLNFRSVFSVLNFAGLPVDADATINDAAYAILPAPAATPVPYALQQTAEAGAPTHLFGSLPDLKAVLAWIWLVGMVSILAYLSVKTAKMCHMLKTAAISPDGSYYVSDVVDTSFVFGLFRPRIYMQTGLTKEEEAYILQHERMHIRNLDHITRIIGVLTVCVYWFNPLIWIAFARMCADLEMRCDEAVIDRMGIRIKREYCLSMIRHALDRGTADRGVYAAFAGDNYNGREIRMRINHLTGYQKVSKIVATFVIVFALGLTVALSTKAQTWSGSDEAAGPVSVPGNLSPASPEENLEAYGKEDLSIPADVVYSDEGRPFSSTYDYKETPVLNKLGAFLTQEGFEIEDPETEYLDQDGNVQTGRELYTLSAYREDEGGMMLLNFYMVSEEYASDSFDEVTEKDGYRIVEAGDEASGWYVTRVYDPRTSLMMDANGTYTFDWESIGLFDAVR